MATRKFALTWEECKGDGEKVKGESIFTLSEIISGLHKQPNLEYIPGAVREFTGISDRFGVDIFESDRVKLTPVGERQTFELTVKWAEAGTWLLVSDTSYSTWRFSPEVDGRDCRCEVIRPNEGESKDAE